MRTVGLMEGIWASIISAAAVIAGVIVSVVLGVVVQSGPRRHIENLKLASEALREVQGATSKKAISTFIRAEESSLERALQKRGLRWATPISGLIFGATVVFILLALLAPGFNGLDIAAIALGALSALLLVLFWI